MSDASFDAAKVLDQRHRAECRNDNPWATDFFKKMEKSILPIAVLNYIVSCSDSLADAMANYASKVAGYHESDRAIEDELIPDLSFPIWCLDLNRV